jgi:hypothetical protein
VARRVFARGGDSRQAIVENLESRELLSNTWFVSPSGSNSNPGSISAPFQTIQQAANKAQPGDHVEIETGVYHETVTPPHSGTPGAPIVFEAYNNEKVTISGADPITGWTKYSGNIYSAPMSWNLGEGQNEVFVNGQAINEAEFPNSAIGNFSKPSTITMSKTVVSGNTAVIYSSSLNQPAGTWNGATIHMDSGQDWINQTGTVTSSSPGRVTVSFVNDGSAYDLPAAGNKFYLFGSFKALDAAGEWYRDPTTGKLYLWAPNSGNPSSLDVEAKHRLYAFNLTSVHDITVSGLSLFAATVTTTSASKDVVLNRITGNYVSQNMIVRTGWSVPDNQGIVLLGANSLIENSTIAFSSGDGIVIGGSGSKAENNVVHDVAYAGTDTGGIHIVGAYVTVDHNTVYNSGRDGILAREPHVTITYNTVHDVGLQTTEPGGIYTASTNGQGSVIAYNQIYNIHTGGYGGTALFADNNSSNWIIHNNVTWNVDYGLKMNYTSNNNQIYNNTLGATKMSINTNQLGNWNGVKIYNNVFTAPVLYTHGASVYNNSSKASASVGAGSFASGASGVVAITPVTSPAPAPPPAPPATTPSAKTKIMAVNYVDHLAVKGDNFGGIGYAYNNDYVAYKLDFGTGVTKFAAGIAAIYAGGSLEIHLGSPTGKLVGTLKAAVTGAWNKYTAQSTTVAGLTGVQTVYLVFKGSAAGICNIDWLQFS